MATKRIGLGSAVQLEVTEDNYVTQGLTRSITPPPRTRQGVDGTVLGDTLATELAGIEEQSLVTFEQLWDPDDDESGGHEEVDDLFDSKAVASWRIVYDSAGVTDTFDAQVWAIEPGELTVGDPITRTVTLQRVGAITRAAVTTTTTTTTTGA